MPSQIKPTNYRWDQFITSLKEHGDYASLAAWVRAYDFNYKTVWALIHGTYVDGAGPKIKAIIEAALKDDLITDRRQAD